MCWADILFQPIDVERLSWKLALPFLALLVLYPPLYVLYFFGEKSFFAFFDHDAFYYLTVAKNSYFWFFTYDGEVRTNSFHPLWQYLLTALFKLVGDEQQVQLYATYLVGCLLVTGGVLFTVRSVNLITGSKLAGFWLIPGLFYTFFRIDTFLPGAPRVAGYFSCWRFMNGMESPLSIFFGGILILLLSKKCLLIRDRNGSLIAGKTSDPWSSSFCLTLGVTVMLCVMSRLDDVFLLPGMLLLISHLGRRWTVRLERLAILLAPTAAALLLYIAFHYFTAQSLLPVSGRFKGHLCVFTNALHVCQDLLPPLFDISPKISGEQGMKLWSETAVRSIAMVVPVVLVLCSLLIKFGKGVRMWNRLSPCHVFTPLMVYVILKAAYNFLNVYLWEQGYWYYAFSILFINFMIIIVWCETVATASVYSGRGVKVLLGTVWSIIYLLASANLIHRMTASNWDYEFWRSRREIRSSLMAVDPHIKLIDRHDGIMSYSLGFPALPLQGYAADSEGYRAIRNHRYLDYCIARGFDTLAGGPGYEVDLRHYRVQQIYVHPQTGTTFLRISRKDGPTNTPNRLGAHSHDSESQEQGT